MATKRVFKPPHASQQRRKRVFKPPHASQQRRCKRHDWQRYINPNIRKFYPQADPDRPMRRCRKCGAIEVYLLDAEQA